jgi:ABC transporter substrate binding protein
MRRRSFLVGAATLGAALPSLAQTGGGAMRRIGVLANNPPSMPVAAPLYAAFYAGLNERGWVEGRNLLIDGRYAAGRMERFAEFAAELVALDVEVIIVLAGTQATQAAKDATSKIPIVFAGVGDAIALGFVVSLARPGGNLTGVTYEALLSRTSSASALSGSRRTPAMRNGRKTLTLPFAHLVYPSYRSRLIRQEMLSAFLRLREKHDHRRS